MDQYNQSLVDFVMAGALANLFALTQRDAYIAEGMAWVESETSAGNNISYYTQLYDGYIEWNVWGMDFTVESAERAIQLCLDSGSLTESVAVADWNDFSYWEAALEALYFA